MKTILKWILRSIGIISTILFVILILIIVKKNPVGFYVNADVCRAATCKECHPLQYKEWHNGQLSAFAAVREVMEADQAAEFAGPLCWKCHDPFKQGLDEGVTCEFCHGKTGCDENLHDEVHKASLERLRDEKWCHQCHSIKQPLTGADLQGTVIEWEQSKARKDGLKCQDCHMPLIEAGGDKHHFHGHYYPGRNPLPGRKSVSIENISKETGKINVMLKNHISAHYFPSGAHTKAMILEVKGFAKDADKPLFQDKFILLKRFKFKKFLGIQDFPYTVYKDTRLKPEEERIITFITDESFTGCCRCKAAGMQTYSCTSNTRQRSRCSTL